MLLTLRACVEHRLDSVALTFWPGFAVSVVLAPSGYPGSYEKGQAITGEVPSGKPVYAHPLSCGAHLSCRCGTLPRRYSQSRRRSADHSHCSVSLWTIITRGALDQAYEGVTRVNFDRKVYRRDIGHRCVLPESPNAECVNDHCLSSCPMPRMSYT